jgi:tRNA modification GTPase
VTADSTTTGQTFLARLTPPGKGAIAVLPLDGPDAWELIEEFYRPFHAGTGKNPFQNDVRHRHTPGTFWLGRLGDPAQNIGDEVVIVLKQVAPRTRFEIHCHGGNQVVALLEQLFAARGVRLCSWPEWLRHTGMSPLEVMAHAALAETTTVRTAAIVLDQLHGAFAAALRKILDALELNQETEARRPLHELCRWASLGRHLTTPFRVVVAGAPNVGKSSLINRLTGYQRSIVSPTPGTTRDLVSTRTAVDGWPVELIDSAGVHDQAGSLETQGIDLALAAAAEADLCLWLFDAAAPPVLLPREVPSIRLLINKIDLPPAWDLSRFPDAVHVSAETGAGIDDLLQSLSRWLVPEVPPAGAAVPFNSELCTVVDSAAQTPQGQLHQIARALYNCLGMDTDHDDTNVRRALSN